VPLSHLLHHHGSRVRLRPIPAMLLVFTLFAGLGGCQRLSGVADQRLWIGQAIPPAAGVAHVTLPEQLADYRLQGEMAGERDTLRVALYRDERAGQTLKLSLYPLPGGWETYTAEHRVNGHYLQARNDLARRLLKRGATDVKLLYERAATPTSPQASAVIEASPALSDGRIAFVLACTDQLFILLSQPQSAEADAIAPSGLQSLATQLSEALANAE